MADIPLFTGPAGNLPSIAPDNSIGRLDPTMYGKGAQAAQYTPSIGTAISEGVQGAVNNYEKGRLTEAEIAKTEQEAKLAPLQLEVLQSNAEAAKVRANTEAQLAPAQAAANLQNAQTQALVAGYNAKKAKIQTDSMQQDLTAKNSALDLVSEVQTGDVAGVLNQLKTKLPDVLSAGVTTTKSGTAVIDPAISDAITKTLPRRAAETGDPQLIAQANDFAQRFTEQANNQSRAANKQPIRNELPVGAPVQQQLQAQQRPGLPTIDPQASLPQGAVQQQEAPPDFQAQRLEDIKNGLAKTPHGQALLDEKDGERKLEAAAQRRLELSKPSVTEQKDLSLIQRAAADANVLKSDGNAAEAEINNWITKYGDPHLGPGYKWEQLTDIAKSQKDDGIAEKKLLGIKQRLDTIATRAAQLINRQAGGGATTMNTEKEFENLKRLSTSPNRPLADNLAAISQLRGMATEANDVATVVGTLVDRNMPVWRAVNAARDYQRFNPGTAEKLYTPPGGVVEPFNARVENPDRKSPYDFLNEAYGISKGRDTSTGRAISAQPVDPHGALGDKAVGPPNATPEAVTKHNSSLTETINSVNHADIPDYAPEGAPAPLMHAIFKVESNGNPKATNKESSAKGLGQLIDETGKTLWNRMGFDGEYNPFNAQRNAAMSTYLMNDLLLKYGGDVRMATTAYTLGEPVVDKALKKAQGGGNPTTWNKMVSYLPEDTQGKAVDYVSKVMGDAELENSPKLPPGTSVNAVYAMLPTPEQQQAARKTLSGKAVEEMYHTAAASRFDQVKGTVLGKVAQLLTALDPASEAQAEELPKQTGKNPLVDEKPKKDASGDSSGKTTQEAQPISNGMQSFALGAARTLLFGWDNEAGAELRHLVYGEPYEEAFAKATAIRDRIKEEHPNWYTSGEAYGLVGGAPGVGLAKGLLKKSAETVAEAIPKAAERTLGADILRGAKTGTAVGTVAGAGEGEPGNRLTPAIEGAVGGALTGGALGGALNVGGRVAESGIVKEGVNKIKEKLGGEKIGERVKFTKGEKAARELVEGVPTEKLQGQASRLESSTNPAVSLGDELGQAATARQTGELISKQPKIGDRVQSVAKSKLDTSDERTMQILEKHAPLEGPAVARNISDVAQEKIDTRNNRVAQIISKHAGVDVNKEGPSTFRKAAETVTAKEEQLQKARNKLAMPLYEKAKKEELADLRSEITRPSASYAPGDPGSKTPFIVGPNGRAIPEEYQKVYNFSEKVPGFNKGPVKRVLEQNPIIANAAEEVRRGAGGDKGRLPINSYDVLKETKSDLYAQSQDKLNPQRKKAGRAYAQLKEAMAAESDSLRKADEIYAEGSQAIRGYNTKTVEQLKEFAPHGEVTNVEEFGKNLLKMDRDAVKDFMGQYNPEQKTSLRKAIATHLSNEFRNQGEAQPGKTFSMPDFTKNDMPGKLEEVFGKVKARNMLDDFAREGRHTEEWGKILKADDPGKYLLNQDSTKLKSLVSRFSPEELASAKKSISQYVKNTLEARKTKPEGSGRVFPNILSEARESKLKTIFGEKGGQEIYDKLKEEMGVSGFSNELLKIGSQTQPRDVIERNTTRSIGRALHGLVQLSIGGISRAGSTVADLTSIIANNPRAKEVAGEIADIVINKDKGAQFLKKELAARLRAQGIEENTKDYVDFFDHVVKHAQDYLPRSATQAVLGEKGTPNTAFKPSYKKERNRNRTEITINAGPD